MRYATLCIAILAVGCSKPTPVPSSRPAGTATADIPTAKVTVKAENTETTTDSLPINGTHSWELGDFKAKVQGGRLTSEGKDYGAIGDGDEILIQPGRVTVNGNERKPEGPWSR